jgi:hypothetical protein
MVVVPVVPVTLVLLDLVPVLLVQILLLVVVLPVVKKFPVIMVTLQVVLVVPVDMFQKLGDIQTLVHQHGFLVLLSQLVAVAVVVLAAKITEVVIPVPLVDALFLGHKYIEVKL